MARVVAVSILTITLLLTSCGMVAQKAVEQATGTQIDTQGQSVIVKGNQGEQITMGAALPDELKFLPLPPGFVPAGGLSMATGTDKNVTGIWRGKAPIDQVSAFYGKEMVNMGWKQESTLNAGAATIDNYTKGDQRIVLTFAKDPGKDETTISAMLTSAK
jgi:hypothetical protein